MHRVRILLLLLGVLVAGCDGATGSGSAGAPEAHDTAGASADGPLYGELTTVGGQQLDGAAYRNADLALWFWAPW